MYEIRIVDGKGLVIIRPTFERVEDIALPRSVTRKIIEAQKRAEKEIPGENGI
jgi:hypothetical protein